jgi:hypothetical protein
VFILRWCRVVCSYSDGATWCAHTETVPRGVLGAVWCAHTEMVCSYSDGAAWCVHTQAVPRGDEVSRPRLIHTAAGDVRVAI